MMNLMRWLLPIGVIVLGGCRGTSDVSRETSHSRAGLTAFASLPLRETDTAYIAKANAIAVSAMGEYFVTEMGQRRILRFDRHGNFVEAIGRSGRGPDEFEGPHSLTSLDDSTLAIVDVLKRRLVLWNLQAKSARAHLAIPGLTSAVVPNGGNLYVAAADVERGTAGLRWRSADTEPERLGTVLDVYRDPFWTIWGTVAMDASGDSILYFGGRSEYLIVADSMWQPYDSLPIPRTHRRGVPATIDYSIGGGRNIYDVGDQLSAPFALHMMSGGRYALFHLDASVVNNSTVVGKVYMTILSARGATRCIDVPVPARDSTVIPRLAMLGDTLFVLDHHSVGDSAVAEIAKYHLHEGLC